MIYEVGLKSFEVRRPEPWKLVITKSRMAYLWLVVFVVGFDLFWYGFLLQFHLSIDALTSALASKPWLWLAAFAPVLSLPWFFESLLTVIRGGTFVFDSQNQTIAKGDQRVVSFSDVQAVSVREPWGQLRPSYTNGNLAVAPGGPRARYGLALVLKDGSLMRIDRSFNYWKLAEVAATIAAFIGTQSTSEKASLWEALLYP
jgi:hypothetical protein